jgi:ribose-phosphate pyrophosphokinase
VLSGAATKRVSESVMLELVVTNSIEPSALVEACDKVRIVSCAPLMGEAIQRIANEQSVSKLFD